MSETLVLRMPDAGRPAAWLVVDAFGNRMGQPASGTLAEVAAAASGRRVRVCVPGASTLLLHADLPTHNSRKIHQALPFALEDQLADDVDHLHFAIGARDARGYPTVVVTQAHMREWLAQLAAAGITPSELVVDVLSLPVREHTLVLASDGAQILMRFPDDSGMVADRALAPLLIAQQLAKLPQSQACTHALVYAADEATQQETAELLAGLKLEISYSHQNAGAIGLMAGDVRASRAINLLQGDFGQRIGVAQYWLRWRVAAILLAVLVAVFIADQVLQEVSLRRQSAAQQAQIAALFHQALPDVTRMVEPRVQMQRRLSQLTGDGGSAGALLPMLASAGAALRAQSDVQLQGFSFHAGVLQLEVQAGNINSLNNLKAALAQNPALQAQLDSVSSAAGLTTARLTLQAKAL
ncbi:MAG: type II secretion system protein GspL [Gammaproteobacteria bacterium]|nr:type II secretion system protein GspL [Gammaproteobacteria bacterium]MBU6508709.1 type II secretion system protein GspL [Gammaproteobacteria bacterium]MDE1982936.1 type II secretion system protein GspL [Gammaproteobacteria bacterium]MDE2108682.1 type II secretion system protein GspL [Gammaproteobacteria bacterium]